MKTQDRIIELAREAGAYICTSSMVPDSIPEISFVPQKLERFAHLVRAQALEEAAGVTGEFAQKWWAMVMRAAVYRSACCASCKHMETARKAHDDFCALQAAIRALKGQP